MAQARCLAVTPAITGVRQCEKARERMQLKTTSGERIVKNRRTFVHKNRTRPTRRGGDCLHQDDEQVLDSRDRSSNDWIRTTNANEKERKRSKINEPSISRRAGPTSDAAAGNNYKKNKR